MMFLNSWRWRTSVYARWLICVSGMPITDDVSRTSTWASGGAVVEQVAAAVDLAQVGSQVCGFIATIMVAATAPSQITRLIYPDFVPESAAPDVGGNVARLTGTPIAQDGRGRTTRWPRPSRAVDVGELDDEIVDCAKSCSCSFLCGLPGGVFWSWQPGPPGWC